MQETDKNAIAAALGASPCRPTRFNLTQVEKVRAPDGGNGQTWYRYVLDNGRSTITGKRCGSLKDVTAYANRYAEQLNTRAATGHYGWSSRSKKA